VLATGLRIAINISKTTAMLFVKIVRWIQKLRAAQFLGEPIQWVETVEFLGVTLVTQLTWSVHVNQLGKKAAQRLSVLGPLLNRRSHLSVRNGVLQAVHPSCDGLHMSDLQVRCPQPRPEAASFTSQVSLHCD
jgi:hypothetical protein